MKYPLWLHKATDVPVARIDFTSRQIRDRKLRVVNARSQRYSPSGCPSTCRRFCPAMPMKVLYQGLSAGPVLSYVVIFESIRLSSQCSPPVVGPHRLGVHVDFVSSGCLVRSKLRTPRHHSSPSCRTHAFRYRDIRSTNLRGILHRPHAAC